MNSNGGPYEKNVLLKPRKHTDILSVGHKNPYQFKNAIKSGWIVFCLYHLGLIVYQGPVHQAYEIYLDAKINAVFPALVTALTSEPLSMRYLTILA
jgi:hypothetical protein